MADDGALLLGECKWTDKPAGIDVLAKLTAETAAVQADLKRPARQVDLAIFSRAGFTQQLVSEARKLKVRLVGVEHHEIGGVATPQGETAPSVLHSRSC